MNSKEPAVAYRNMEVVIYPRQDITDKDIVQEHPMICTEPEHIRYDIEKSEWYRRHSSNQGQDTAIYTEEIEQDVQQCTSSEKHRHYGQCFHA